LYLSTGGQGLDGPLTAQSLALVKTRIIRKRLENAEKRARKMWTDSADSCA